MEGQLGQCVEFRGVIDSSANTELKTESVMVNCKQCKRENFTKVENKVHSNGIAWAIICCCCGSWLLSLLVLCMDGFKEFTHYCPSCNAVIGIYKPKFHGGQIIMLILFSIGMVILQFLFIIYVVMPQLEEINRIH